MTRAFAQRSFTPRVVALAIILAALAALATTACDGAPGRPDPADAYVRPSEVMAFDDLYATNCSGCHGADGSHGPALALANPRYLAWAPREAVRAATANGVAGTGMPAFARSQGGWLTDAQIDVLVDGAIAKWGGVSRESTPELPVYAQSGGDAMRGALAYREYCEGCHGADRSGGAKASSIVQPEYLALVSDQSLRATIIVGRPDLGMPGWDSLEATLEATPDATPDISRPMSAEQIDDVVAWLASFRSEP